VNNQRGLSLQPGKSNLTLDISATPNVVAGNPANRIDSGVNGAVIGGGGYVSLKTPAKLPNIVTDPFGTVSGGAANTAGNGTEAGGEYATVPGGFGNSAKGAGSLAAGRLATANHAGTFVWGDGTQSANSTGPNRFEVLATGGVNFYTGGAGTWTDGRMRVAGDLAVVQGAGSEQAYLGGDGLGADVQLGSLNPEVTRIAAYTAGSGRYMELVVGSLTILGGADLAEPFPVSDDTLPEGSVVVIDSLNPGQLQPSTSAYDTRVAGVISGAGGIHPGISLRQEGAADGTRKVALTGRVYVRADASHGAIRPGDLLTTSDIPGHAMRAADPERRLGAILGKAMTGLNQGRGLVLVLVSLQ
jgi:hypothetical protein